MTDIVEVANKLYNRQYLSFSRGMCQFGEVLTFKGTSGELTILESEMQFHLRRAEEIEERKLKKSNPAELENFEKHILKQNRGVIFESEKRNNGR